MGKMHEILAIETDQEGTFKKVREEAIVTLSKKSDHFIAFQKSLEMFDEAAKQENFVEQKEMVTTVKDKLSYVAEHGIRYFDVVFQKERTNQIAKADLIVDGNVLATDLPATFLLGMETKLKNLRELYEAIPTLAPGIKWELDENLGRGIYQSRTPDIKMKTAKTFQHKVLTQPTDKHPAQIEKWEAQVNVGKYTVTTQCSMMTPAEKSRLIGNIDKLIQGCKQARQRANCAEIMTGNIGKIIFDFINT